MTNEIDIENWNLIVGFFLPLVMSVLIQTKWPKWLQAVTLFVVSLIIAGIGQSLTGGLEGLSWLSSALVILVTAIATYHGLWKPTNVAPALESATNFGSGDGDTEQQVQ